MTLLLVCSVKYALTYRYSSVLVSGARESKTTTLMSPERVKWSEEVLEVVLRMCIKEVKARLRKIISELRRCGLGVSSWEPDDIGRLLIWHTPDYAGELVRIFTDDLVESPDYWVSNRQIMVHYLCRVVEASNSKDLLVDIDHIIMVVTLSYTIGLD